MRGTTLRHTLPGMTDAALWVPGRAALLERDHELQRLTEALEFARAGHGRLTVLDGPMGIGRTRLLAEVDHAARASGFTVLRARGSELERELSFRLATSLFEADVHAAESSRGADPWRGPAALARPLFTRAESAADEFAVLHGLYWLMVNLTERAPVAVLIDDVHWADQGSLRYLHYLADRLDDLPVALVVAVRTGDPEAEFTLVQRFWSSAGGQSLTLRELTVDAVARLLAQTPQPEGPPEPNAELLWRETRGNPFFVAETLAAARGAHGRRPTLATTDSIRRHVAVRLQHLGTDVAEFARAASILTDEPPLVLVARLAQLGYSTAAGCAERLTSANITVGADPVRFRHRMLRSAIAASFGPGRRSLAHARAALVLHQSGAPSEYIAQHLLDAPPSDAPWAREVLHDAARTAARRGAPAAAVTYLRRAIDGTPLTDLDPSLLVSLGLYEAAAGEITSLDRFEQALRLINDNGTRAEALYSLGQTQYRYGRYREAAATFHKGAELFGGSEAEVGHRFRGAELCSAYYLAPEHHLDTTAPDSPYVPLPPMTELTAGRRVLLAIQSMHAVFTAPPAGNGAALARLALGDGALLREQSAESLAINMATLTLLYAGELTEANAVADAVVDDARDRGAALAFAEASMIRALIRYQRGHVTDATVDAEAAVAGMRYGWHSHAPSALATLVHCLIERGETDQAHSLLRRHETDLAPPEAKGINAWFFVARGRLRLLTGDPAGAARDLEEAEDALHDYAIVNPAMLPWRSLAGAIAHTLGDDARARQFIDAEVDLARQFQVPIQLGVALRRRALLDSPDRAIERLREAVAMLTPTGASLELCRALLDLGSAQRRAGQRVVARAALRQALDLAHHGGASAAASRAHEELIASGARPRRTAASGLDSLTPTEKRIATLAAAGHSNRRIAELVFVSRNTIAWHLRNIYRKLDVDSRESLSTVLDPAAGDSPLPAGG